MFAALMIPPKPFSGVRKGDYGKLELVVLYLAPRQRVGLKQLLLAVLKHPKPPPEKKKEKKNFSRIYKTTASK